MTKPNEPAEGDPQDDPKDDPKDDPATKPQDDPKDDPEGGDPKELGDAGKKALDIMKRERNAARKEMSDLKAKLKEFEDKDKTEAQRLQESLEEAKTRAAKAESGQLKLQTAIAQAPEGATMTQIRAVAKRLSGESEEDLKADADELFALFGTGAQEPAKKTVPGKPKETLTGGGDPGEEPDETDPRKLADLIGRH